jgi:hypothetical protein
MVFSARMLKPLHRWIWRDSERRAHKLLRFGETETDGGRDLVLNSGAIQAYNQTFIVNGAWLTPTVVLSARFATVTAQVDF